MRTLWVRMAEIYGHRWTSSYGDSESGAARTWAKGLAGVSPAQLAAARMVRDAYEQAREFVMRGGQLPAVVAALEGQGPADAKPGRSWREPSESALENELAFIRQQFAVGALGEGGEAVTERDALIAAARQRHATAATTPAEAEPA